MDSSSLLYIAAGMVTLSVTSAQTGFGFGRAAADPVTLPRWLPYAVLIALAVGSAIVGIMYPEAVGANID